LAVSIDGARPAHHDWSGNGTVIDQLHVSWPGVSSLNLMRPMARPSRMTL
jgi:hypothetical protein